MFFRKHKVSKIDLLFLLIFLLFTVAAVLVSLNRFWQYDVFFYDFGIFDQAIWHYAHFQPPIIDHIVFGGKWIFADHFSPSLALISPIYWFTSRQEALLVVQALSVGISGLALYQIGKTVLKEKLLPLCISISYYLFVGLQNAVIFDFHEVTILTLFFLLTFLAFIKKKKFYYWLFLIIMLGFKESSFLTGVGIGAAVFLINRKWRKTAVLTIIFSIFWGIISIKFIIPHFSGGVYLYTPKIPLNPIQIVLSLFDDPVKIRTLFYSFLNFGFLPLLSPPFWIMVLLDYITRFVPTASNTRWGLDFHYNMPVTAMLALSSLFSLSYLKKTRFAKFLSIFGILILLDSLFLYRFILHAPLGLSYNPVFYAHTKDFAFLNDLISKIPKDKSVMTQNNLAVRFTHQQVWILRFNYGFYKPDYIVIDLRSGQNLNDFYASGNMDLTLAKLKKDKSYSEIYNDGGRYIFKRIKKT